jgi:hypothetical protein
MVGPDTLYDPGGPLLLVPVPFFAADQLRDLNKYKFNQKTRSIHVFTFRETQNPDRLDTFDFDKHTLKIINSARKHQTFNFFCQKVMCNFDQNFRSIG